MKKEKIEWPNNSGLKKRREAALENRGIMWFLASLLFLIPITVLALYVILGWQYSVLAFPLLLISVLQNQPFSKERIKKKRTIRGFAKQIAIWSIFLGIPIFSVMQDEPNFMRLWSVAVAILFGSILPIFSEYASKTKGKYVFIFLCRSVFVLAFIGVSELIWFAFGLGLWVLFHSSFLLISTLLWVMLSELFTTVVRAKKHYKPETTAMKLPRLANGDRSERFNVSIKNANGNWITYENAACSQSIKIFEGFDWETEDTQLNTLTTIDDYTVAPFFYIDMVISNWLYIYPKKENVDLKINIETKIDQSEVTKSLKAIDVPIAMVPEIIRLAWIPNWTRLERKLSPYIDTNQ